MESTGYVIRREPYFIILLPTKMDYWNISFVS